MAEVEPVVAPSAPEGPAPPDRPVPWVFYTVFAALAALLFVPMAKVFSEGHLFGGDWGQYLLTSEIYLHPANNMLNYPEPVLPALYVPVTLALGNGVAAGYVADVVSGALLLGIYLAAYLVFRELTGSGYAGMLGGLFIGTAPLMIDEVGWAGQAQFLAIIFGLLATWALLRKVLIEGRSSWAFGAGLFLGLAVLTESYSTLYFLVGLLLFLLIYFRSELRSRKAIVALLATLGIPLVSVFALARANPGLTGNVLSQPIWARATYLPMYKALYLRFSFDSDLLLILYPSILLAYLLLWPRLEYARASFRWFVPAFLAAWVPQFLVLTPVVDTDRALYFAFLPAGGMVALIARSLPGAWRRAVTRAPGHVYRTRWGVAPRGRAAIVPAIAVVALLTIGAQAGVSGHSAYGSMTYYGYASGVLSELNLLDAKNGSLLLVTPNLGNFASSWASGRNTFFGPPSQPATFTRTDQQTAVINGNLLSYGASWVGVGDTWAVDAEPYWGDPAPLILQYTGSYLFQSFEMNDSMQWVTFSPVSIPSEVENLSLFSAPMISHVVGPENLTTTYSWTDLTVTKTIGADAAGNVTIAFRCVGSGITLRSAGFSLVLPNPRPTSEVTYASALPSLLRVTQVLKNGFLPFAYPNTVGFAAPGANGVTRYSPYNSSSLGEISTVVEAGAATRTDLNVTVTIAPIGLSSPPGTVTDERTVLATNGISWVAVERSMGVRFLERFLDDPEFTLYASTPHYLIFETDWG